MPGENHRRRASADEFRAHRTGASDTSQKNRGLKKRDLADTLKVLLPGGAGPFSSPPQRRLQALGFPKSPSRIGERNVPWEASFSSARRPARNSTPAFNRHAPK